ncbi:hypothetical protein HMPREF1979_01608 [Actinomyces johnsonii F0542]|uniref:Uncharacterized protein n=1 Tax=Actinomyces johnsonii F0542 TaxID=1321818 RepID=U1RZX4_9ACTO|nr:hypothetical protein HMPREF1979_01608 [Actinomyces johnsonii F0542]
MHDALVFPASTRTARASVLSGLTVPCLPARRHSGTVAGI